MIYLDNAATTFPKPPCMTREIIRCISEYCGNPGRSGHFLSLKAAEKVYECRELLCTFFGAPAPENVVFTGNTTYAINIALHTLYEEGAHILISNMEHNSVLRPVVELQNAKKISYSIFNVLQPTEAILKTLQKSLHSNTKMLIMQHASNVCGHIFPIREIGEFCNKNRITFVVDAAQSAGVLPIHVINDHIDALCLPAHKGLYGPQGLGMVIFGNNVPKRPFICGGNGAFSASPDMGTALPESLEGGTLPTPLIAGLCASLRWLHTIGIQEIRENERRLATMLSERLLAINGSILYGPKTSGTGIVLYNNRFLDPSAIAAELDMQKICTRGGLHCAPLAHCALKTGKDGAVRFSFGAFNTPQDVESVYAAMRKISK